GVFALWIVLAAWMTETAGEEPPNGGPLGDPFVSGALSSSLAIDGYLIVCGLMAARAARGGARDLADLPRFIFWRTLRFAPALATGFALFFSAETALQVAGLPGAASYFAVNPLAIPIAAAFIGSVLIGAANVVGALNGAIGRAGLAAFVSACVAMRMTPGIEMTTAADIAIRLGAAFTLGVFLDSVASSGRIARSIRRLKAKNAGGIETAALIAMVAVMSLTPLAAAPAIPVAMAGYFLIFTRSRGVCADNVLCAPMMLELGRAAAPMISCAFIITWPLADFGRAFSIGDFTSAVVLAPLFVLAVFGLAFAVRRLAENPARAFSLKLREGARRHLVVDRV
ncbi:MAG: hypothetical protein AAFP78_02130, partial [Pseudomonadota bacterium]